MSRSALSIAVWAGYVVVLGVFLLILPNVFLSLFGIEETSEVWIRVLGVVLVGLAFYYWVIAREEIWSMMMASAVVRGGIAVALVILAFIEGPWQLVLFAIIDLAGGLWTYLSMRSEQKPAIRVSTDKHSGVIRWRW